MLLDARVWMLLAAICQVSEGRSCKHKYRNIPGHYACLDASPDWIPGAKSEISPHDKDFIVKEHNRYRALVVPPAANMVKMVWDDELEMIAKGWSEQCHYGHEKASNRHIPGRYALGQNMALNYNNWNNTLSAWYNEHLNFQHGVGNIRADPSKYLVGNYVQMVYAEASRIGCAQAECNGTGRLYVCNYVYGVIRTREPYKTASIPCKDCPGFCKDGLCDFGGKACENGGDLNLRTGECMCQNSAHLKNNCELNCSAIKDIWYCNQYAAQCKTAVNVPPKCPHTCGECPAGGIDFVEPTETPSNANDGTNTHNPTISSAQRTTPVTLTQNSAQTTRPRHTTCSSRGLLDMLQELARHARRTRDDLDSWGRMADELVVRARHGGA